MGFIVANQPSDLLQIVVACSERKRNGGEAPVRLADVVGRTLEERCMDWWRRLTSAPRLLPASELYAGDQWAIARELPLLAKSRGFAPSLWVVSAGYGLVPAQTPLASYSATFASDSPDSVIDRGSGHPDVSEGWWGELSKRSLPDSSAPRSLTALAASSPQGAAMLVVVSPRYLRAVAADLEGVLAAGVELMIVTSAPRAISKKLHDCVVPTQAALRMALGGALPSLHVRVARRLLIELSPGNFSARSARRCIQQIMAECPDAPVHQRERMDDDQVRSFIREAMRKKQKVSHTGLLRELRASGRACEQKRFRELFALESGNR